MKNNWEIKKLKELGAIFLGGTPNTSKKEYWNGDINWLTPSEVSKLKSKFIFSTEKTITELGLKNSSAKILPKNSLIVCTRATIGDLCINKIDMCTNQGFKSIIVNKNNNVIFLYFLLLFNRRKIIEKASGSTFLEISKFDFENLSFPIPPLEEQEKIVSILSKQDEVIEKLEKLIELKVRQKKGLMQRLLSGKLRLKGFSGDWKENIMQSIILIFKKTKHNSSDGKNNGKYPFFINNSESFLKFLDEFDYDAECIIANTGGNAFFDYYNGKFSASSDCFIFSSKINTLFLYYFLKSIEKTVNIVGFAGSGIKHLNKKWFYKLKILIPPTIEEQSAIASILSKCDEEIELLKKKLGLYRGQKKWLMEKLLSGEIRV